MTHTTKPTYDALKAHLDAHFGGVLHAGSHRPDGEVCMLEFKSQYPERSRWG